MAYGDPQPWPTQAGVIGATDPELSFVPTAEYQRLLTKLDAQAARLLEGLAHVRALVETGYPNNTADLNVRNAARTWLDSLGKSGENG